MGRSRSNGFAVGGCNPFSMERQRLRRRYQARRPAFSRQSQPDPRQQHLPRTGRRPRFPASAQTASGTNIATTFTFSSSDTSILTLAPNGVACAGHWDVTFTTCTPGATGPVQVTASALGASSVPTYVFVHPPIDNITVTGILLNGVPVQEPCLSQSQSMTVEAHAFSQGTDITSSVGPFTWSANNPTVVNLIPLVNSAYDFPPIRPRPRLSPRDHPDLRFSQRRHQYVFPAAPVPEFAGNYLARPRFL